MFHVYDIDFFKPHVPENLLVHFDWLVPVRTHLTIYPFEHPLSEQIVLHALILLEGQCLLLPFVIFVPSISTTVPLWRLPGGRVGLLLLILGWVHAQQLQHLHFRDVHMRLELDKGQGIKGAEVSHARHATMHTEVTTLVDQRVYVHTAVADPAEVIFV